MKPDSLIKPLAAAVLLAVVCVGIYWPSPNAEFVLDDYYTVVRNPLIKNPALYQNIWTSRLFDANQSSGYIKFGYYRPVLQSSWILDYRLFGLRASGFQWVNLLIHAINGFLIYILLCQIFGQASLSLKASLLFCVLPSQEWVVRYVTGRGDELSVLFALVSLSIFSHTRHCEERSDEAIPGSIVLVLIFWALSALTREVAISYILYGFLIYKCLSSPRKRGSINKINSELDSRFRGNDMKKYVDRFSFYWTLIGILPLVAIASIIPKQGNILAFHLFYFASIGLCLWLAQLRARWVLALFLLFAAVSFYQGRFWTTERTLLRHTRGLEFLPRTVAAQQLLMKYDDDIPAIKDMIVQSHDPMIKAMWLRRLGTVYFAKADLSLAQQCFLQALSVSPLDVDALNALAVVYHDKGQEPESLKCLNLALAINPSYPDTLRTLGIHYYIAKNYTQARVYLSRCLLFDPDNKQAQKLLSLAKAAD